MNIRQANCVLRGISSEFPSVDLTAYNNYYEKIPANIQFPQQMSSSLKVSFGINQLPHQMLDGLLSSLNLKFKINKLNGKGEKVDLTGEDMVAFVAGGLYSAISSIELHQDGNKVCTIDNVGYLHHMVYMLSKDADYLDSVLTDCAGFSPDHKKLYDEVAWDLNSGLFNRYEMCQLSKPVELQELLIIPAWASSLNLVPSLNWVVQIQFQDPDFFLQQTNKDNNKYVVDIQSFDLIVNRVNLREESTTMVQNSIANSQFEYPFTNYQIHTFGLPDGGYEYRSTPINMECYPKRVYIALVNEKDKLGQTTTTPFHYRHLTATKVELEVNGRQIYFPETDFKATSLTNTAAYKKLIDVMGVTDRKFAISREEFNTFSTIYAEDLTFMNTGDCTELVGTPKEFCTLSIKIKFDDPLPDRTQVLILTEADFVFGVSKDYSSYIKPLTLTP